MNYRILNNGVKIPLKGFGVFQITDHKECERVVTDAIDTGYRLIDTASVYGNEKAVGEAIRKSGIEREKLFITSKAWISEMGYDNTLAAFDESLSRLGLDYIDLYLIHMPFSDYHGSWRAMEHLYSERLVRAIGVCNFEPDRLSDLCHWAEITPAVNQVEIHPFNQQQEALDYMLSHSIQPEAWAPLAEGRNNIFNNEHLIAIGNRYGKTAAQVILRWHLQRGVVAIPKSVRKERMIENFNIDDFSLSNDEMAIIANLSASKEQILDLHSLYEVDRLYDIKCKN